MYIRFMGKNILKKYGHVFLSKLTNQNMASKKELENFYFFYKFAVQRKNLSPSFTYLLFLFSNFILHTVEVQYVLFCIVATLR